MRNFALTIAAVVMLAAPAASQADDRGKLTTGEARSAARAYVTTQVESLEQFNGLTVAAARVGGPVDRIGHRTVLVPTTFALHWDDGRVFLCSNGVWITKRGQSIHTQPGNFNC